MSTEPLPRKLLLVQTAVAILALGLVIWASLALPPLLKQRDQLIQATEQLHVDLAKLHTQKAELEATIARAKATLADLSTRTALGESGDGPQPSNEDISQLAAQAVIDLQTTATDTTSPGTTPEQRERLIAQLFDPAAQRRTEAYQTLMAEHATDPELVPELIDYAESHPDNSNGVYNSLVLLSHLDYSRIDPDLDQIQEFALQARATGPRTAERADKLVARLPESDKR